MTGNPPVSLIEGRNREVSLKCCLFCYGFDFNTCTFPRVKCRFTSDIINSTAISAAKTAI